MIRTLRNNQLWLRGVCWLLHWLINQIHNHVKLPVVAATLLLASSSIFRHHSYHRGNLARVLCDSLLSFACVSQPEVHCCSLEVCLHLVGICMTLCIERQCWCKLFCKDRERRTVVTRLWEYFLGRFGFSCCVHGGQQQQ